VQSGTLARIVGEREGLLWVHDDGEPGCHPLSGAATFEEIQRLHRFTVLREDVPMAGVPDIDAVLCAFGPRSVAGLNVWADVSDDDAVNTVLDFLRFAPDLIATLHSEDCGDAHVESVELRLSPTFTIRAGDTIDLGWSSASCTDSAIFTVAIHPERQLCDLNVEVPS
jgi:hypothetical protein